MSGQNRSDQYYHSSLYYDSISAIPGPVSDVFEQYSGIPKDKQLDHVVSVRNSAYKTHPYPCLGRFRFLELELSHHPLYESYVVPTLKRPTSAGKKPLIFLDLGTCLGQDLRKLIYDGASPSQLYGSDIEQSFIDTGYEMFLDENKMPRDHFLCPADVFQDPAETKLSVLKDQVDLLNVSAVFHLFDKEKQIDVARCCMRLLRKDPGARSLVLGAHVGNIHATETTRYSGRKFRHNEKTWKELWEEVCQEAEFRDKVQKLEVKCSLNAENWTPTISQVSNGKTSDGEASKGRWTGADIEEGFRWMRFEVWVTF